MVQENLRIHFNFKLILGELKNLRSGLSCDHPEQYQIAACHTFLHTIHLKTLFLLTGKPVPRIKMLFIFKKSIDTAIKVMYYLLR